MGSNLIYGATFKVYIRFTKSLKELAELISQGLQISEMRFENLEEEPYNDVIYFETLGFEAEILELGSKDNLPNFQFVVQASTMDSFEEISKKRMYDLSLWMARFMAFQCKIVTFVKKQDGTTGEMFYYDTNSFDVKYETLGLES